VGVTTYNRPEGLRRALGCLVNQTYTNLEIIVSDNCSPGSETEAVGREFQTRDPRIRFYRQAHNAGMDANFKFVLDKATGPFFFWAADDDEWTPDFVEVCLANIGDAGSFMPGMVSAVRSRGLLRPKPPLNLSPSHRGFDNAVAFFINLQPCLFYSFPRTETVRVYLQEFMYDYYDCFFILRQILTHGVKTIDRLGYYSGVDTEATVFKPARPRTDLVYEYRFFLRDSLRLVLSTSRLTLLEKVRLIYLLIYFTANEFAWFERSARPRKARLARLAMALLRPLRHVFRVPLPKPPPVMTMPDDPAQVPSLFLPAADLTTKEGVHKHLGDCRSQLRTKEVVVKRLKAETDHLVRWARAPRRLLRTLTGFLRRRPPRPATETLPELASSLEELRRELGLVLLGLQDREARIQGLVRKRARYRRLAALGAALRALPCAVLRKAVSLFRRRRAAPAPTPIPAGGRPLSPKAARHLADLGEVGPH